METIALTPVPKVKIGLPQPALNQKEIMSNEQPQSSDVDCMTVGWSSRVCNRGTKGCDVTHEPPATDDEMPFDAERAKKALDEIGNRSEARHGNIEAAPATDDRVKEQEWTPETVEKMHLIGPVALLKFYKVVADAHNAALDKHDEEVRKAATKAENKRMMEFWKGQREIEERKRKLLVELLRSVHRWFMQQAPQHYNGCGLWIDVDAELAEHPSENCILDVDSPTAIHEREEYLQCGCANCRDALAKVKESNLDAKTDLPSV